MSTRERFEAAWRKRLLPEGDYASLLFNRSSAGHYFGKETEAAWQGFRLGEASGLERAAAECERLSTAIVPVELVKELWLSRNCFKDGEFQDIYFQLQDFATKLLADYGREQAQWVPLPEPPTC